MHAVNEIEQTVTWLIWAAVALEPDSSRCALTPLMPMELVPAIGAANLPTPADGCLGSTASRAWCFRQSPSAVST